MRGHMPYAVQAADRIPWRHYASEEKGREWLLRLSACFYDGHHPLLSITKEVFDINRDFVNTMIDICSELSNNPPFPRLKDGLDELWNYDESN